MDTTTSPAQTRTAAQRLPVITRGIVMGFTSAFLAISLASLVFAPLPAEMLGRGIAIALVTSGVSVIVIALFSAFTGVIANVQDNPAVLLTTGIAALTGSITSETALLPTAIILIFVTTLMVGALLFLVGRFRLGALVRYVPYPVIGGFLAGTGWLLVRGAFNTMTGYGLSVEALPALLLPEHVIQWLPGLVFALVLFVGMRRIDHFLTLPVLLLVGIVLFFVALLLTNTSADQAARLGLLLGENVRADWQPVPLGALPLIDFTALSGQLGTILTVMLLATLQLLMNISAMEVLYQQDVDLNRELRVVGLTNLLAGLLGGMIAYHGISLTTLGQRIGVRERTSAVIAGGFALVLLAANVGLLSYAPKPLIGGLLLFLGFNFLYEWVVESWRKFSRIDYGVIVTILVIIAVWGFLVGISVGLFLMVLIFVVNYSRTDIIHHKLSGAETRSKVERTAHYRRALGKLGRQVYILELRGFIFFGKASGLLEEVRLRLNNSAEKPLQFLILDFRRVTGLDSSVAFSFVKMKALAKQHGFTILLTSLSDELAAELARGELMIDGEIASYPDLDRGLEWCEEQLLNRDAVTRAHLPSTLNLQLADMGMPKPFIQRLRPYLQPMRFAPGDVLMEQGASASELYFIEVGQVSVFYTPTNGSGSQTLRLQTLSLGTIVGELGLFLKVQRTASVIADTQTLAYKLTAESLEAMQTKEPDLAIAFQAVMLRAVAERLNAANQQVIALSR